MSVNEVILVGRLGQDPDARYTPNGLCVVNCSLATDDYYNNENHTEWHKIVVWGKPGEAFANLCRKGSLVYVRGKIQTESYEDAQGAKRYMTKVNVREWKGLGNYGAQDGDSGSSGQSQGERQQNQAPPPDDDIPF